MVNLAGVAFVDVGGMLLLLGATRRTAGRAGTLYLAGCNAMLIRLLVLTGNLDAVSADLVFASAGGVCQAGVLARWGRIPWWTR